MKKRIGLLQSVVKITAMFGYISKQTILSQVQQENSERMAFHRMRQIFDSGMFTDARSIDELRYLGLSNSGRTLANTLGVTPAPIPSKNTILHDELVTKIALSLSQGGLIRNWVPEIQLKLGRKPNAPRQSTRNYRKYPDLVFDLNVPNKKIRMALEVELTMKSRKRYRTLLYKYSVSEEFHTVVFVTETAAITRAIKEVMSEIKFPESKIPLLFGKRNEVESDPCNAPLVSSNRTWTINSAVQIFKENGATA